MNILTYRWPNLKSKRFTFSPPLIATILTLLLLPLFISLGLWQWSRAQENQSILQQYAEKANGPAQALPVSSEALKPVWRFTPVYVKGQFLKQSYLLDNAIVDHHVGYRALSVFAPEHSQALLFVDRGFMPVVQNRKNLPEIKPLEGEMRIQGILDNPYRPAFHLRQEIIKPSTKLIQEVNLVAFEKYFHKSFYPFVLLLPSPLEGEGAPKGRVRGNHKDFLFERPSSGAAHHLLPQGEKVKMPQPANKVTMHQGYALQWFTFAATLFTIYLFVNLQRNRL